MEERLRGVAGSTPTYHAMATNFLCRNRLGRAEKAVISALWEAKARELQVQGQPQQIKKTCLKIKCDTRLRNIVHRQSWNAYFAHIR